MSTALVQNERMSGKSHFSFTALKTTCNAVWMIRLELESDYLSFTQTDFISKKCLLSFISKSSDFISKH